MADDDTLHVDMVQDFRLLTPKTDPDFIMLRITTRDGKSFNFGPKFWINLRQCHPSCGKRTSRCPSPIESGARLQRAQKQVCAVESCKPCVPQAVLFRGINGTQHAAAALSLGELLFDASGNSRYSL